MHRTVLTGHSPNGRRASVPVSESTLPDAAAPLAPVPINVTPATPHEDAFPDAGSQSLSNGHDQSLSRGSFTTDTSEAPTVQEKDRNTGRRRVQRMERIVKKSVHAGQARITTISRKIGGGIPRSGSVHLRRSQSVTGSPACDRRGGPITEVGDYRYAERASLSTGVVDPSTKVLHAFRCRHYALAKPGLYASASTSGRTFDAQDIIPSRGRYST
jgi:hypothetical protein